jgi:putative oxidoreductase
MGSIIKSIDALLERVQSIFTFRDFLQLWLRLWIAKIFYDSGRTKAGDSFLQINDFQGTLFEEEYGISFIDPEIMAQMALYAETFLPLMLLLGVASRLGALGLLGMTLFIQVAVYPTHFMEHGTWAAALLAIIMFGAGKISLDSILRKSIN